MTAAGFAVPADAQDPAVPPDEGAGEVTGPAREQFGRAPAPEGPVVTAAAQPVTPTGVDLYENNAWFADGTVAFMILKAYEYREDSRFAARFPLVKSQGRLRGAYLFGHPGLGAVAQAASFVTVLRDCGFGDGDRAWLDFEVTDGKSPSYCAGWAGECCAAIDGGLGLPLGSTGVYTYSDFIAQGNCAGLGSRSLWFARPAPLGTVPALPPGPWTRPELVQYQVTSIDWDFYNGTAAELAASWAAAPVPLPPPPATSWTETLMSELPVLAAGASGEDVKSVQGLLRARGYAALVIDGSFGPATRSAVTTFQYGKGLVADGSVGPATWPKLLNR